MLRACSPAVSCAMELRFARPSRTATMTMCVVLRTFAHKWKLVGTRQSKVTVLLDRDEFARLDQFCQVRGFKKSTLISRLIREYLDREAFPSQPTPPLHELLSPPRKTHARDTE